MNKKGSIRDVVLMICVILMLALGLPVLYYSVGQVTDKLNSNEGFNSSTNAVNALEESNSNTLSKLDMLTLVVYIGFMISLVITGYLLDTSSIFFIIYVIALFVIIIVAGVITFVWENISNSAVYLSVLSNFPITNHLLTYLPFYTVIAAGVSMFALYMRNREGSY